MPTEIADTKIMPAVPDTDGASYALGRAVVEVSLRPMGIRLGRIRLPARDGALTVTDRGTSIRVALSGRPERRSPLARWLVPVIGPTFTATGIDLPSGSHGAVVHGGFGLGSARWSLPLTVRAVATEDTAIVLAAHGPLRPPRTVKGWRRRLYVDIAVEFTR